MKFNESDMTAVTREGLIEIQVEIWGSLLEFCNKLTPTDWKKQTNCPTWTVKDCLSHLVGIESRLLGYSVPKIEINESDHVNNSQGLTNEIDVVSRRSNSPEDIVNEFMSVTAMRTAYLKAEDDFSVEAESPVGIGSLSDQVSVRIFDCWVHLQDMRMAINVPCDFVSKAADLSFGRMFSVMPFVVGKKVGATDGTTVVFEVYGDEDSVKKFIDVSDSRASFVADSSDYNASILCPKDIFFMLTCGRIDPVKAVKNGLVKLKGDTSLGEKVVSKMNFMI